MFKQSSLTPEILHVVKDKGTEYPFTGPYTDLDQPGTYLCRQCGLGLFYSEHKFHSSCGWPSFDEEIPQTIQYEKDSDGRRTEIICMRCHAHLGHVFKGEGFTAKNIRHCVNSTALDFVPNKKVEDTEEAIFAAGCFWGVEYFFQKLEGVLKTEVGYTGGSKENPTYEQVCSSTTGHYEAIRAIYDPKKINYETLVKYFFEIHDPTQKNGQGPDIGEQYLSAIFFYDEKQKKISEQLIQLLESKNFKIATRCLPVSTFWPAEEYHQAYYDKKDGTPYCHYHTKRF